MRSPSRAPRVKGLEGSIESTATSRSALRISAVSAPIRVLLPTPGRAGEADDPGPAGAREDLADELPAGGVVVLDQGDRPRQGALVAGDQALGEALLRSSAPSAASLGTGAEPRIAAVLRALRFYRRNGMLNRRYARLLWRYLLAPVPDTRRLALADRRPGLLRQATCSSRSRREPRSASAASAGSATGPRSAATRGSSRSAPRPSSARSARSPPTSGSGSASSA